ncbi:MAG: hypothetical protein QOI95_292 [Acidimicrobiaceae bacterium]|jgi:hypothetical protein
MMSATLPAVGQTVVVRFGPDDVALTRCETTEIVGEQIVLTPVDPLSGAGRQGDGTRLIFKRAGVTKVVDLALADDATSNRLVLVPEQRREERHVIDLSGTDLTGVGDSDLGFVDLSAFTRHHVEDTISETDELLGSRQLVDW